MSNHVQTGTEEKVSEARRKFLADCGKFAVITPPVVTLMLSSADRSYAKVYSGKAKGNNGFGNGGGDPAPGNSGNNSSSNSSQKKGDIVR